MSNPSTLAVLCEFGTCLYVTCYVNPKALIGYPVRELQFRRLKLEG